MIAEVAEAIMKIYNNSNTLKTALSGGMYFTQAPQDATKPYCVFYFISSSQEEIMGTQDDNLVEIDIQFSLFSAANDGGQNIAALVDTLTSAYDWVVLNVENYNCIKMQRESITSLNFVDEIWQSTIDYTVGIQKEQ